MKQLKHPNIIQLYDVFENEDIIYIIMEYCEYGDLYSLLHSFKSLYLASISPFFTLILFTILNTALSYFSSLGISYITK